jgi:glycosyltransferase involved in cell wall biosynthesis
VPPRQPPALAAALLALLGESAAVRRRRGEEARARIGADYGIERIVARYAELYLSLAAGRR